MQLVLACRVCSVLSRTKRLGWNLLMDSARLLLYVIPFPSVFFIV